MGLPIEPACLPLLLGSLPHWNTAQALELSRRYAGKLLAWPQLPGRSFREQNFVQSAIGFPGLVIDMSQSRVYVDRKAAERDLDRLALAYLKHDLEYAALSPEDAASFQELLRQGEHLRQALALKGQLIGPISLATYLVDDLQRPLIYDKVLREALCQHLYLRAAWQDARLAERGLPTIICIDEPFLETAALPFLPLDWQEMRDQIDEVLSGVRGCKAIFAGGAVDWSAVFQTSVELAIADVYEHGQHFVDAAEDLVAFLERDGMVGLGIIPTDEVVLQQTSASTVVERLAELLGTLEARGVAVEKLLRRAVVSPSSSLEWLSIEAAEQALRLLDEVSHMLRDLYALS